MRKKYKERDLKTGFGDKRHYTRLTTIQKAMESNLSGTIPEVSLTKASSKAMYRFFANESITPELILQAHQQEMFKPLSSTGSQRFIQIDDSTELDFTNKKGAAQLGPLTSVSYTHLTLPTILLV